MISIFVRRSSLSLGYQRLIADAGSWSNQIAPWQWYIHGTSSTDKYLGLSPNFKNPSDASDALGLRITIVRTLPHGVPAWKPHS